MLAGHVFTTQGPESYWYPKATLRRKRTPIYKTFKGIQLKLIDNLSFLPKGIFFFLITKPNQNDLWLPSSTGLWVRRSFPNMKYSCWKMQWTFHCWLLHSALFVTCSFPRQSREGVLKTTTSPPRKDCSCFYWVIKVAGEIIYTHTCKIRETSCFIAPI